MKYYITQLLKNNENLVKEHLAKDPKFFINSLKGQEPKVLWISCADSRVPHNEITKTEPGEIFVHCNIANLVIQTDMNMLSVVLNEAERFNRLVELSVTEQVYNLGKTNSVQNTWGQRKSPYLHAWVYNIGAGYVKEQAS